MATERTFHIEEVRDRDESWSDLKTLSLGIIEYHRPWNALALRADWAERMHDYVKVAPGHLTLIARNAAGKAVAFVNGSVTSDYGIFVETFAFINNFYVQPEARSQGVGREMLRRFEEWATAQGATDLRLNVLAGNDLGQRFWDASGFVPAEHVMSKPLGEASR